MGQLKQDRFLHAHFRYYVREVRCIAYSQVGYTLTLMLTDAYAVSAILHSSTLPGHAPKRLCVALFPTLHHPRGASILPQTSADVSYRQIEFLSSNACLSVLEAPA